MNQQTHDRCTSCSKTTSHYTGKCRTCRKVQGIPDNSKNWGGSNKIVYDELGFAVRIKDRSNRLIRKVTSG